MEETEERGRMYGSRECATWGIGQVSAMVTRARCLNLQRLVSVFAPFEGLVIVFLVRRLDLLIEVEVECLRGWKTGGADLSLHGHQH